jgi:hypothetical protein
MAPLNREKKKKKKKEEALWPCHKDIFIEVIGSSIPTTVYIRKVSQDSQLNLMEYCVWVSYSVLCALQTLKI